MSFLFTPDNVACNTAAVTAAWRSGRAAFISNPPTANDTMWSSHDWQGATVSGFHLTALLRECQKEGIDEAHLIGARIEGAIALENAHLPARIRLDRCLLIDPLVLADATGQMIEINESVLMRGMNAERLQANILLLQRSLCSGRVNVSAAQLGRLDLGATTIAVGLEEVALDANVLTTSRSVNLNQSFRAIGSVRFIGAAIGGQLNLRSGHFRATGKRATVTLHEITTGRALYLRDAEFDGKINLSGARIGGRIDARDAQFSATQGHDGIAIDLSGASVERAIQLSASSITGTLRLHGCRVGTQLRLDGTTLSVHPSMRDSTTSTDDHAEQQPPSFKTGNSSRVAMSAFGSQLGSVNLESANIAGDLLITDSRVDGPLSALRMTVGPVPRRGQPMADSAKPGEAPIIDFEGTTVSSVLAWKLVSAECAELRFTHMQVGRLEDDPDSWKAASVDLRGLRYGALPLDEGAWNVSARLKWLGRQTPFSRQPYYQFASHLLAVGRPDAARKVGVEREEERRRRGALRRPQWILSMLSRFFNGHGYRPGLAVLYLLIVIGGGVPLYTYAFREGALPSRQHCTTELPCFNAFLVSADAALPIIDLGYGKWVIRSGGDEHRPLQLAAGAHIVLGWTFASLAVATYTRRAIRE